MTFKLQVEHIAEDEAGMAAFLLYIQDNHAMEVIGASVNSRNKHCLATLAFTTLAEVITAVTALKQNFTIEYRMNYEP